MTDLSVEQIVDNKDIFPTIVNEASKFVVVTYWWGRGRLNKNTSRPCISFYEDILMKPFSFLARFPVDKTEKTEAFNWLKFLTTNESLRNFYRNNARLYTRESGRGTIESNQRAILEIIGRAVVTNVGFIRELQYLQYRRTLLEQRANSEDVRAELYDIIKQKGNIKRQLTAALRNRTDPSLNFFEQLERALEYIPPLTYEQMIQRWDTQCEKNGCNHMAVEYPEFTLPGGYQKAINAKPLFIKKALDSCGGRAVVYIDGDMTIDKYPHIFDLDDVDMMARGWNMDPRANRKYLPSEDDEWEPGISFDPYVLETSGGIMYFSSSRPAHALLNFWIEQSAKPINEGKADDRILSLIFNTYRFLAPMKIIQLPIEYLWLTLAYDEFVARKDPNRIYVSHPECLTTEDTAGVEADTSGRQPKYYDALETLTDRSEMLYESVMFPSQEMANQFRPWLDYIGTATYYDGPLEGQHPQNVVSYGTYGPEVNAIVEYNIRKVAMTPDISTLEDKKSRYVLLTEETFTIPNILRQFSLGHDIFYIPNTASPGYVSATRKVIESYENRIELIFADTHDRVRPDQFFLFTIDLLQPIYIHHGNPILYMMLTMCRDLNDLSNVFHANYQFLSRIRIHVLKSIKNALGTIRGGGNEDEVPVDTTDATDIIMSYDRLPKVKRTTNTAKQLANLRVANSIPVPNIPLPPNMVRRSPIAGRIPPGPSSSARALTFSRLPTMRTQFPPSLPLLPNTPGTPNTPPTNSTKPNKVKKNRRQTKRKASKGRRTRKN